MIYFFSQNSQDISLHLYMAAAVLRILPVPTLPINQVHLEIINRKKVKMFRKSLRLLKPKLKKLLMKLHIQVQKCTQTALVQFGVK